MLVEDVPMGMELATDLLVAAGYRVVQATTGEEALAAAARERPDLILMDIGLPGMDGLETTRRLKRDPATAGIPVVALTSMVMRGDEDMAIAAGCVGCIAKPIDTRRFAKTVAEYMGRRAP